MRDPSKNVGTPPSYAVLGYRGEFGVAEDTGGPVMVPLEASEGFWASGMEVEGTWEGTKLDRGGISKNLDFNKLNIYELKNTWL